MAWKSKIDFEYLQRVQSACYKPMEKLGYRLISSQQERDDPDFDVLEKSAQEISLLSFGEEEQAQNWQHKYNNLNKMCPVASTPTCAWIKCFSNRKGDLLVGH